MILAGCALAVGALYLVTQANRLTGGGAVRGSMTTEEMEKLRLLSVEKEAAFEQVRLARPQLTEADIRLLAEALQAQEDYITARGALGKDNGRLDNLRRRYHTLRAELLRSTSDQVEAAALELAKTDPVRAAAEIRRAIVLEREISEQWVYSGLAEPGRLARLDTRLRRLESEPLWRQTRELEAEGKRLAAQGRHAEAAGKFDEALATERTFLEKYRDVRATEFEREDQLTVLRDTERSHPEAAAVEQLARQAADLEQAGRWEQAVTVWGQAVARFQELLVRHPRSTWADRARDRELTRRGHLAQAHPRVAAIERQVATMRTALAARRVGEALSLAASASAELQRLNDTYPGIFPPTEPVRQEIDFIVERQSTLTALLPEIDRQLQPLPGAPQVRLLNREVSQALYASLVGANPSAQRRDGYPVDSVSYGEAERFCQLLGWALGAKVRLPTVAELGRAAGDVTRPPPPTQAWTFANGDGINTHAVASGSPNAAGFHDVLGNVEEWTLAAPTATEATVAGGSVGWLAEPGFPAKVVPKREKSRILGFRILVE
jgi:tetratricopeptide (TPR) repeat protein